MQTLREFTPLALILGILIGIVFGAANAFIGLKVGMTVSASIPAAVISMAVLRGLLKRGTVLENNIVQTVGSVGESLAAGMIFTIPALYVFAQTDNDPSMAPTLLEMTLWGAFGGLLGVFFMIPLRRMLIVKEHKNLPYPEGTACAEVLQAGQAGGVSAATVFWGLGVGMVYEFLRGLGLWAELMKQRLPLVKSEFQLAAEPALLGVGYILGVRVAGYILGGAVLGWFVIIPAIAFFGAEATTPMFPEQNLLIADMSPDDMWNRYLRYIGAGAVVLGGLVSLFKSLGVVGGSVFHMFAGKGSGERTDRDIPVFLLLLGVIGLGAGLYYMPDIQGVNGQPLMNELFKLIPVIACVLAFGFIFTTVSARLVGIVGGSSNPASGMTIATLLGTALIIVNTMDLSPTVAKVAILSVGALVCICICMAGDTSQDLKTGYLVGATPWKQQVSQIIGVLTATAAIAAVLYLINDRYGYVQDAAHPNAVLAPQANLMKLLIEGVVDQQLPWVLILIGIAAALIVELLGLPSLPFAVGLYLPLSLSTPIMVGGLLRWLIDAIRVKKQSETHSPGILAASGLVAGHGLMGVIFVGVAALIGYFWNDPRFVKPMYVEEARTWANYDAAADTWTYSLDGQPHYLDEDDGTWVAGSAPARTRPDDAPPRGELVIPKHLYDWMTTRSDALQPEFGLRPLAYEQRTVKADGSTVAGPFSGKYALDWWHLLPAVPFGLLTIWLGIIASRRGGEDLNRLHRTSSLPPHPSGPGEGEPAGESDRGTPLFAKQPRGETPPPAPPQTADEIELDDGPDLKT